MAGYIILPYLICNIILRLIKSSEPFNIGKDNKLYFIQNMPHLKYCLIEIKPITIF